MIKINLAGGKKQMDLANVGGFDLTKLKIKPLLLVIVLIYVPDFLLVPMWETEREEANQIIQAKQTELSSLKRKMSQTQDLEKQIRELQAQEENLGKKLTAVKEAISEKRSPAPILLYIAKNIPNSLWLRELDLDKDIMTIKGDSLDYISIGNFVNSMKSSVFIKDANITETNNVVRDADKRRVVETFEVRFGIARFDQ